MLVSSTGVHARIAQLVFATLCVAGLFYLYLPSSVDVSRHITFPDFASLRSDSAPRPISIPTITVKQKERHPIDDLIIWANDKYRATLDKRTRNLHDAAEAYRVRRGRHPPPHFDAWFKYAQQHSSIIVEDYFDRIYENLDPFWGVPAKQVREQANDFIHRISVRNGEAKGRTDIPEREWINLWQEMIQSVAQYLPDMDIPINVMDESRIVTPWEEINEYMTKSVESRKIVPEEQLKTEFTSVAYLDDHPPPHFDPKFNGNGPYWDMALVGCHPESPARQESKDSDFSTPPPPMNQVPKESYQGYVSNWTFASSPCENAELQGLHGSFVAPVTIANTKQLFPLFGGSKLEMNNEILLPPATYWTNDPFYSGGRYHGKSWNRKKDKVIWRGAANGGRNTDENWKRFQRHRFVSMVNATNLRHLDEFPLVRMENFDTPINGTYDIAAQMYGAGDTAFSDWVATWSDVSFVHLICFPGTGGPECPYTDPYFSVSKAMPMKDQYDHKYLPDIDGNSFSGRYRGFLGSTSLPIKATIYQEWHDSRLVPWKHFIPMHNTFIDFYGIMEYFVGNKYLKLKGRDALARVIAQEGKSWAEKVLRKEDMSIYVFRLLLEYARLCDDERERMGWAESSVR